MARATSLVPVLALVGGLLLASSARAENDAATGGSLSVATGEPPIATSADGRPLPEILLNLPHVPDQPRSLYDPAAPLHRIVPPEHPYFVEDPLLDLPELPPPGWFAGVEAAFVQPHLKNKLVNTVTVGANPPDVVGVQATELDWTVAPEFWAGYRLPSGYGECFLSYRFLASEGTTPLDNFLFQGSLRSRLDFNIVGLDYGSWEISLWPKCDMQWLLGLRLAYSYFDSRGDLFASNLLPGSVIEQRTTNSFVGIGPHAGLLLAQHLDVPPGLSLYARLDGAEMLGRIRQGFFEEVTPLPGGTTNGETRDSGSQGVPVLTFQGGVSWQPPGWTDAHLFVGYVYEHWWAIGSLNLSSAEFDLQGLLFRAECNF